MPQPRAPSIVDPARQSLIEEGVIDRQVRPTPEGGYDDDATVHSPDPAQPPRPQPQSVSMEPRAPSRYEEEAIDRPLKEELYDDSKTEFAGDPPVPPVVQDASEADDTIVPGAFEEPAPEPKIDRSLDPDIDPWNEATVGYPEGEPPPANLPEAQGDSSTLELSTLERASAEGEPLDDSSVWSELSGDFDPTLSGDRLDDDGWGDRTAANGTYLTGEAVPDPIVQDSEGHLFGSEAADATLAGNALDDDSGEFEADATISSVALEDLSPSKSPAFDEEATLGEDALDHLDEVDAPWINASSPGGLADPGAAMRPSLGA